MAEVNININLGYLFEPIEDRIHAMSDVRYDAAEILFMVLSNYPNKTIDEYWYTAMDETIFNSVIQELVEIIHPILIRLNIHQPLLNVRHNGRHFIITTTN